MYVYRFNHDSGSEFPEKMSKGLEKEKRRGLKSHTTKELGRSDDPSKP